MHLELSDEEAAALKAELKHTISEDRYPLSPRIRTLQAILDKIEPALAREPQSPPKIYAPPRFIRGRRRR
jgi:hypothetical protein